MRINEISPQNVQKFIGTLGRLSPGYVRTIYSHLRAMMNSAAKRDDIAKTPCIDINLPGIQRADLHYLEPSEVRLLIDAMNWPYRALFGILGLTGIRVGEALALRMKNVDFLRKEISIEDAWDINARIFHEPKTGAGLRKVGIMSPLVDLLQQYFEHYPMNDRNSLLFPSPTKPGQPVSYNTICGVFKKRLKKIGLPDVTIHSLRHSFASILLSVGVSVNTLARHLGHSSPDITYRIYAHEISENLGDGLERASQLFGAAGATNIVELNEWRKSQ
jgi:integrase